MGIKKKADQFDIKICSTGQQKEMLKHVINFFDMQLDYDLKLMRPRQTLFDVTSGIIKKIEPVFETFKPDITFVQGDQQLHYVEASHLLIKWCLWRISRPALEVMISILLFQKK